MSDIKNVRFSLNEKGKHATISVFDHKAEQTLETLKKQGWSDLNPPKGQDRRREILLIR